MSLRIDKIYQDFFEEIFAILGEELDPITLDDSKDGVKQLSELAVLGVTALIPENIEEAKKSFDSEF